MLLIVSTDNKAPVYSPVDVCKADGVTLIDPSKADSGQSGCNGGDQFMCSCLQPFNDETDTTLALGYAAFTAGNEQDTDCACYYAEFAHDEQGKPMKRNKLIFQVINTGGDVNSGNIDFQIPGGGLGAFTQGCSAQWKTPAQQWGETYGGVQSASACSGLPEPLQEGCKWRFSNWGNNPVMQGSPKRVRCPKSLIDRSGCQRKDDVSVGAYQGQTDKGNVAAEAKYKRDRSVCMAGGQKEGYGDADAGAGTGSGSDSGTGSGSASGIGSASGSGQTPPTDSGSGSTPPTSDNAGSSAPGTNGAGSTPPMDNGGSTQPGSPDGSAGGSSGSPAGSPAPGADKGGAGQPGFDPTMPIPAANPHHKMNKVCKKHH